MTYEEPGAIIAGRREELGLTRAEVAARLGYENTSFISMMERGTSRMPLERVFDIARALGLDTTWFLERMLRDRAETLPLADHLFGPGAGRCTGPRPRSRRRPGGRGAGATRRGTRARGAPATNRGPDGPAVGSRGAPPRPGERRPGGGEAVGRAPAGARGAPARPVQPPALPVPLSWLVEIEGRIRLALRPDVGG